MSDSPETTPSPRNQYWRKAIQKSREAAKKVLGEINWTPPSWIKTAGARTGQGSAAAWSYTKAHKRQALAGVAGLVVLGAASWYGYHWYSNRPVPRTTSFEVKAPGLTSIDENGVPRPEKLVVRFAEAVAQLKDIGKQLKTGVTLTPKHEGTWFWVSDRVLEFTPAQDWPIHETFKLTFERTLFPSHVLLQQYDTRFNTEPFTAQLLNTRYYENPGNPNEKRVVGTLAFSHPVDSEDLKKRIEFRLKQEEKGVFNLTRKTYGFSLTFGKFNTEAYLHSDLVEIPERDSKMFLEISSGVRAARGGNTTSQKLQAEVTIPSMYNYFRVQDVRVNLVPNEAFESDQVLSVQASTAVAEKDLRGALAVRVLPKLHPTASPRPKEDFYRWESLADVTPAILSAAPPLSLEAVPNEFETSDTYNFKFNLPVKTYVHVKIESGLKSAGGYVLSKPYEAILEVPPFPAELRIMSDGGILSLSGEKKLSILSRAVDEIEFEIARVLPTEINHLITQTTGSFTRRSFNNYRFNEENITERFTETRPLPDGKGRNQYTAFDLGKYLTTGSHGPSKRGLFFVKIQSKKQYLNDQRFILMTDLGIVSKAAVDQSHDLFVQSFATGQPVSDASVEVLGKNGIPLLSLNTDAEGKVHFPPLEDYKREAEPTAYVVRKGADIAFLPYDRYSAHDRNLDFSRFDIGGVRSSADPEKLTAFLFSDRGIYRPGDRFNIGLLVRSQDWQTPLNDIPLEAVITDARGLQIHRQKLQLPTEGFGTLDYKTEETSPTGTYAVNLFLIEENDKRSLLGSTTVRVEEFLPDTMRIATHLSQERRDGWVAPDELKGLVRLTNLYGTPAENREVKGHFNLTPASPSFSKHKEYRFFEPLQAKKSFSESLTESKTNEKGEAEFDLDLNRFDAGTYQLRFSAEGFAMEGGRSVSAESSTLVSSLQFLVGTKSDGALNYIKKGSKRTLELIAVNPTLEKIEVKDLRLKVIELRAVSVLARQPDGTFRYESVKKEIPVASKSLGIAKAGSKLPLATETPGDFKLVLADAQGKEVFQTQYSVVGQTNVKQKLEKNSELRIKLSKPDYSPGEDVELEITAPYTGAGLITIEREKVFAHKWFKTSTTASTQRIRVPAGLEGGAYVNVAFVRGLASPEIYTSPLSYGVVPFSVSRERRNNEVTLQVPDEAKPGEPLKIRYQTQKSSKIVVFAVDEGILQVARYVTPDPLGFFFRKRAMEVSTMQLLDLILPEFSIARKAMAAGGDGSEALGKNLNPFKRKRDLPVAFWSGIIDSGPDMREITYPVPDYFNGTLRVMAVAVSSDRVGAGEAKSLVRGPFVITPTVPNFATPGDEFQVGLAVSNLVRGSGENAPVTLKLTTSEHLTIAGEATQELKIGEGREVGTRFRLKANDILGSGNLTFVATSGKERTKFSVDISIRPAVPYVVRVLGGILNSGKAETEVARNAYPHFRDDKATLSHVPLGMSNGLFRYLDMYPYGCTEQLVSKAFPAVVLKGRSEFGHITENVEKRLNEIIRILMSRQNATGAIAMWSPTSEVNTFYSLYAYHFLTEARERGLNIPKEVMTRLENYFKDLLHRDPESLGDARDWAYAAYLLGRNGVLVTNELVALRKHLDSQFKNQWQTDLTGLYLAATYRIYRQENEALDLIRRSKLGDPQTPDYRYFYDGLRRDAQYLYLVSRHFPDQMKEISGEQLDSILRPISRGLFNTVSASYAILALDAYATQAGSAGQMVGIALKQKLAGASTWTEVPLSGALFANAGFSDKAEKLQFENSSKLPLFYQVVQSGFDRTPPREELKKGVEVFREIRAVGGAVTDKAKVGDDYEVHIRLRSLQGGIPNLAVVDLLPSGFEVILDRNPAVPSAQADDEPSTPGGRAEEAIVDPDEQDREAHDYDGEMEGSLFRLLLPNQAWAAETPRNRRHPASTTGSEGSSWQPEYVDVREDRILLFGSVTPSVQEFIYRIKATNAGTFIVPPIFAEGMYDRSIQAIGLGGQITVEGAQ